jgi:23S rRNA pseudouridine2605 synthase
VIHQRAPQSGGRAYIYHRSPGESLDAAPADVPEAVPLLARLPKRAGRRFIVVSPMPRIDGGLEFVCGDGELVARLQRSVRRLSSELSVRVRGELIEDQIAGVLGGVLDSGERLSVSSCEAAGGEGANRWYAIVTRGASGKDVRQLFERQGAIVSRVLRTRLGPIALDRALARGHFRELTREEIEGMLSAGAAEVDLPAAAADEPAPERHKSAPAGRPNPSHRPGRSGRPTPSGRPTQSKPSPRGRSRRSPGAPVRRGGSRD